MRLFFFIFFLSVACFGEFLETDSILGNSQRVQINDTLVLKTVPIAISPDSALCTEGTSKQVKKAAWPTGSDSVGFADSARAANKADTALNTPDSVGFADSARAAHRADTSTVSLNAANVQTNYFAMSKGSGELDDSLLQISNWVYEGSCNPLRFGNANTTNPRFQLLNTSTTANTFTVLSLFNLNSMYGYAGGRFEIRCEKMATGLPAGYNRIAFRTMEDYSPFKAIDHIVIDEETSQLILNDSLIGSVGRVWQPVWIKNGGLQVDDTIETAALSVNGGDVLTSKYIANDTLWEVFGIDTFLVGIKP